MDHRDGDEPEIPPPPPPPVPGPSFTAPPMWERGRPIELAPRTFGEFIDGAANLYRLHFRSLIGVVALLVKGAEWVRDWEPAPAVG